MTGKERENGVSGWFKDGEIIGGDYFGIFYLILI